MDQRNLLEFAEDTDQLITNSTDPKNDTLTKQNNDKSDQRENDLLGLDDGVSSQMKNID